MRKLLLFLLIVSFGIGTFAQSETVVVKAQAGDTVTKLAARVGADPVEVAKHNGLLPNSVLGMGREIRIPRQALSSGSQQPDCYSNEEIGISESSLPTNYRGNNLMLIASRLRSLEGGEKDEFETTAQFRERIDKGCSSPIVGNLTLASYYAFLINATFLYDADTERMNVEIDFSKSGNYPDFFWTYAGTTPCIDRTRQLDGSPLRPANVPTLIGKEIWRESIQVPLGKARQLKPRLRALVITKLAKEKEKYTSGEYTRLTLYGELIQIWVFDFETGNIIGKFKFDAKNFVAPKPKYAKELESARRSLDVGKLDDALDSIRRILVTEPMCGECYLILGLVHLKREQLDEAVSSL